MHGGSSASQAAGGLMLGSTSIDLQGGDSDESENRRDWTIQVPPEILGTLTDKDKKFQEVINGQFCFFILIHNIYKMIYRFASEQYLHL